MVPRQGAGFHHGRHDGHGGGSRNVMGLILLLLLVAIGAGFFYWSVILTEGAYLGSRVVTFLYDRGAGTYDRVKEFDAVDDAWDLAMPLQRALKGVNEPLILDVATGTGRIPLAMLRRLDFDGQVVGLDISLKMLQEARRKMMGYDDRTILLWKDASALPFRDATFDAVACVEALEFMADPRLSLHEMARVLRPGGTILLTNRVGFDALLMPGRAFSDGQLRRLLGSLSLTSVEIKTWQTYYDLVWAKKEGNLSPGERSREMRDIVCCPQCIERSLVLGPMGLACQQCDLSYAIEEGIVYLERPLGK